MRLKVDPFDTIYGFSTIVGVTSTVVAGIFPKSFPQ
jgi:hypothetical protein